MTGGAAAEEAALLTAAGQGDQRAATALYDAYADALYGFGLARLADPLLAEELVQRVLEKAWRRSRTYDPQRGSVRAFVFTIASSTVQDLRRAAARHDARRAHEAADVPVDDAAEQVLTATAVRAALERLTPDHRRVLTLAYERGLSQREIAEVLDLPLGTVKSRTYYALHALRLACDELGVTP